MILQRFKRHIWMRVNLLDWNKDGWDRFSSHLVLRKQAHFDCYKNFLPIRWIIYRQRRWILNFVRHLTKCKMCNKQSFQHLSVHTIIRVHIFTYGGWRRLEPCVWARSRQIKSSSSLLDTSWCLAYAKYRLSEVHFLFKSPQFLFKNKLLCHIKPHGWYDINCLIQNISDHAPLVLFTVPTVRLLMRGTWKFNNSLLGDEEFVSLIQNRISEFITLKCRFSFVYTNSVGSI